MVRFNYYEKNLTEYVKNIYFFLKNNFTVKIKVFGTSMKPIIKNGDILLLEPFNYQKLKINDIIFVVINNFEIYFIHRIININKKYIITKGDNSKFEDYPIYKSDIIGILHKII